MKRFDALHGPLRHTMPTTPFLHPDEKVQELAEVVAPAPNGRGLRRYQLVYVVRDDAPAVHQEDLGPASRFRCEPFRMFSGFEDTVAQIREEAAERRQDDYWRKVGAEIAAESTLITDHANQAEELIRVRHNRSVIGPGVRKQRNGFDWRAAREHIAR